MKTPQRRDRLRNLLMPLRSQHVVHLQIEKIKPRIVHVRHARLQQVRLFASPPAVAFGPCANVEMLQRGEEVPPIRLRFDGTDYLLEDGFHRVEAAKRVGVEEIEAEVLPGTLVGMEANYQEYLKALKKSLSE